MAGKFKLEINVAGFNEVRRSQQVQEDLHARGDAIARATGLDDGDISVEDSPSPSRARVVVVTASPKAMQAEASQRVLTRAFEAGRG
jgi:hypothetical protein